MDDVTWHNFSKQLHEDFDQRIFFYAIGLESSPLTHTLIGKAETAMKEALESFAHTHQLESRIDYIEPQPCQLTWSRHPLHAQPNPRSATINEVLHGEALSLLSQKDTWCYVRRHYDAYLGWLPATHLSHHAFPSTDSDTVTVQQLRGHLYAQPKVSAPRLAPLASQMRFTMRQQHKDWLEVSYQGQSAYMHASQLCYDALESSPHIKLAERFIDVPYVWGGVTAWGLDCSGFVQLLFRMHDIPLPRDANQQRDYCQKHAQTIATAPWDTIDVTRVQAGDILFFVGHVALCHSNNDGIVHIIHANGKHMRVSIDAMNSPYGQELQASFQGIYRLIN